MHIQALASQVDHYASSGSLNISCHFSTEMAEFWSPATFFEDVWTYKISALSISCTFGVMELSVEITKKTQLKAL